MGGPAVAGHRVSLVGRAAIVTGGGRGIGAATAIALAEAGASVALAARNEAQVVEVAAQLRRDGLEAFAFRCDVTDPRQVRDLALSAREAMGQIDILINNAGTATSNPLAKIALAEWEHIMAVNATGTFLCTQAVLPAMLERRWGRVVNVASLAGLEGDRYIAAYVAAKHAVVGFTKAVIARIMHLTGRSWHDALRSILAEAGQERLIRAAEVADAVLALCGDDAASRNGEIVVLDGRERG
jgi:NAD(P)-dependent dehydrogenase (short-subunit alcohol dehydrogenase family)